MVKKANVAVEGEDLDLLIASRPLVIDNKSKGKDAKNLNPTLFFLQVFRNVCFWDLVMLPVLRNSIENT